MLALVLFTFLFMTSAGKATTTVEQVTDQSPAATMGLRAGDRIVSIEGQRVEPGDVARLIQGPTGRR